jgi:hypothetical protein
VPKPIPGYNSHQSPGQRFLEGRYVGMNEAAYGGRRFAYQELAAIAW